MQRKEYVPQCHEEIGLICINTKCNNVGSKLRLVEDKIIDALKDWLKEYNLNINDYISKVDKDNVEIAEKTLAKLKKNLSVQNKKISSVYDFFEDGTYSKEMFNERITMLETQKCEIESNIEEQKEKLLEEQKKIQDKKDIVPKLKNIIDIYPKLKTAEEKNILLKTVVKKVIYEKNHKSIGKNADPTDFRLDIYPNIYHVS